MPKTCALQAAKHASANQPGNLDLAIDYAHHLLAAGHATQAIATGEAALKLRPNSFRAQRFMSTAYAVAGEPDLAAEAAERAVSVAPENVEARLNVASLLVARQQPRSAVIHLMAVMRMGKETSVSWRILSTALSELGRPDQALVAIDRAIGLDPRAVEYRVHRASVLISRNRYDEALDELAAASSLQPDDASVLRTRSGLLEAMGREREALGDAERAVALDPNCTEFRAHLLQLQAQAGIARHEAPFERAELEAYAAEWTTLPMRPQRSDPVQAGGFVAGLRASIRIVSALISRDMRSRFGRSRLGYFWVIMEPIGHLLTLGTVFAFLNHGRPLLGTDLYLFYVTGLVPFLVFSHVVVEIMPVLAANIPVLSVPIVKQSDVIIAKSVLVLWTESLVAVIVFGGFVLLGRPGLPNDLMTCIAAILALWLLAIGFGLINMIIAEMFQTWEAVISAVLRLSYFLSGIYYSPIVMPSWIRSILAWNPVLQGVELFRSGFYKQYDPHWLDVPYLLFWIVGCLIVGLSLHRVMGKRLVVFG